MKGEQKYEEMIEVQLLPPQCNVIVVGFLGWICCGYKCYVIVAVVVVHDCKLARACKQVLNCSKNCQVLLKQTYVFLPCHTCTCMFLL